MKKSRVYLKPTDLVPWPNNFKDDEEYSRLYQHFGHLCFEYNHRVYSLCLDYIKIIQENDLEVVVGYEMGGGEHSMTEYELKGYLRKLLTDYSNGIDGPRFRVFIETSENDAMILKLSRE